MSDSGNRVQVIIPTITKDYLRMRHLVPERILTYLPASELIFIGNDELCGTVNSDITERFPGMPIRTISEEELVNRQPVIDCILNRVETINKELVSRVRPGWYYQQFLKMSFSDICEGDYYVSWDMDTVPLRPLSFFDRNGKPAFDLKSEYNPGYFKTIENLLGLKKNIDGSFISEHMIFSKAYMKELIASIGSSSVEGNDYKEKVINSIDGDYLALGFSEFETYGTFVTEKYPDTYTYRKYASFRRGSWFIREGDLNEDDIKWLSGDFDAISFENADPIEDMVQLFRNPKYRGNMSAGKFYETILESGYFGEYSDGRINAGDWFAPV